MNTRTSSLPDSMHLPLREAVKLNAWAAVAVVVAFSSRLLLRSGSEWGGISVAALALLPVVPAVLYWWTLRRWMRSLDELQRGLQLRAVCFGTLGMLLIALVTDQLRGAGLVQGLNFGWEGYFAFTFFLYAVGLVRENRRFR